MKNEGTKKKLLILSVIVMSLASSAIRYTKGPVAIELVAGIPGIFALLNIVTPFILASFVFPIKKLRRFYLFFACFFSLLNLIMVACKSLDR